MSFRLKLLLIDGTVIISPIIAPNNPKHTYNDLSIADEIGKIGGSIVKYDSTVIKFECIKE